MDLTRRYTAVEGAIRALSGDPVGHHPDGYKNTGYPGVVSRWNVPATVRALIANGGRGSADPRLVAPVRTRVPRALDHVVVGGVACFTQDEDFAWCWTTVGAFSGRPRRLSVAPVDVYVVRGAILAELRRHRLWKPAQAPDATSRRLAALVPEAVVPALVDTFCAVGADAAADVLVELAGPLWDILGEA